MAEIFGGRSTEDVTHHQAFSHALRGQLEPSFTRHIQLGERRVGFVAVKPDAGRLLLDHLYIRPGEQRRGAGKAVLDLIFAQADAARLELRVGALRQSAANRFYERHGFVKTDEGPWDIYYARSPASVAR